MKNLLMRAFALVLCCACLVSCVSVASAETYETTIHFKEGRDYYGPSTAGYYHRKNNDNEKWSAQYTSGWNATTKVYLYDQQYGDRATHIVPLTRGEAPKTDLQYLGTACCQSSHYYKIVAGRDISQFSGAYDFKYIWTI